MINLAPAERPTWDAWHAIGGIEARTPRQPVPRAWAAMDERTRAVAEAAYKAGREATLTAAKPKEPRAPLSIVQPVPKPAVREIVVRLDEHHAALLLVCRVTLGLSDAATDADVIRALIGSVAGSVKTPTE